MYKTLLIIGIGDLAGLILNLIVQGQTFGKIVLAGRNIDEMTRRKNLAILFSAQLGRYHKIDCVYLDLDNIEQTAAVIAAIKPGIILNTATRQSWRIITQLPEVIFKQLDKAQLGPWLPMHLSLVRKLMLAVADSGEKPIVVNAAFPDAVGAALKGVELAPDIGIGNVANVIPSLRGAVAILTDCQLEDVKVGLWTQHYLSHRIPTLGNSGGAPYVARAYTNDTDVTEQIDFEAIFALASSRFQRTGGAFRQLITASSAMSVLTPLLFDLSATIHAPGPNGLPGGYQVSITNDGIVSVNTPKNVTLDDLIEINRNCQRFDGIDSIEPDGTVIFTLQEMSVMKKMLHYECLRMPLSEVDDWAAELGIRYRHFSGG